jgi:hypothetical protein
MKKLIYSAILISLTGNLLAQPVTNNTLPAIGSQSTLYQITGSITHGSSGAAQTWDYSSATNSALITYEVIGISDLTGTDISTFPTANYFVESFYGATPLGVDFKEVTATRLASLGSRGSGGSYNVNNMPIYSYEYGMNLNDNFTFAFNNGDIFRTVTYDAYGTLTTPYGTYNNVIRLQTTETGVGATTDVLYTYYATEPVMHSVMNYVVQSGGGTANKFFTAYTNMVTGTVNTEKTVHLIVYPNPVQSILNINAPGIEIQTIEIQNLLGETVYFNNVENSDALNIDVENFNSGIYMVTLVDSENNRHIEKFVKQ